LICLSLAQADYGHRQRYTATELAIVVAASLANHIVVQEGLPVGLITEARDPLAETATSSVESASMVRRAGSTLADRSSTVVRFSLPPRSGRGHLMNVLEVLARVQVPMQADMSAGTSALASSTPFVELLRQAGMGLSWGATLCIITGRESPELFDAILSLRRAGFAVTLILVQPALTPGRLTQDADYGARSEEFRLRTERMSVPVHTVWQESDLARTIDRGIR